MAVAERHLLFGLLALQNGLIDQVQLVAAFQAWTRDKDRSLAEHLMAHGDLDDDDRAAVEVMVERHLRRHGGDTEKSLASLPIGRTTFDRLGALADADVAASLPRLTRSTEADPEATSSFSIGSATSDGQRFRVLRPHARGGLGAVFVALDGELNREVALKQILDHHADDPTSRQRFLVEAEVTGGLEHPGIVPVYGLGTYSDGRPYYAMRFIRGDSLKDAIAAFHDDRELMHDPGRRLLELSKLLRRFLDICNAIGYAHTRGVLHRDIKPGNVIVGKHGETLVVDWGLAKPMGRVEPGHDGGERVLVPSSGSGSASTLPGSALGTPAYMSPEQASGDLDQVGPRSDVYSLGATLYCLLTGRQSFAGDDIGEVLRKVQRGDFVPPRQLDPAIDPALEAVCLRAMSLRPEDRYATSRALADDLERWMADEPVSAWREPVTRRLKRWARRNRTAVSVVAASVLVALVGLTAVIAVQSRANSALTDANSRLELANRREVEANAELKAANERERQRFALAQEAIGTFHTGVSEDLLLKQKEFGPLRTRLLRGARDFYQKLERLLEGRTDRESRLSLARSYGKVGWLTEQIDTTPDALAVYRRALEILEDLTREAPDDSEIRHELGRYWFAIGRLKLATGGGTAEGLADLDRARATIETGPVTKPPSHEDLVLLATIQSLIADNHSNQLRYDLALEAIDRTCADWDSLIRAGDRSESVRLGYAASLDNRGMILKKLARYDDALEAFAKARLLAEELVRESPDEPRYGHELVRTLGNMGLCLSTARRFEEASATLARAKEVILGITAASPTNLWLQRDLAWIEGVAAQNLIWTARHEEAIQALERARIVWERQLEGNPEEIWPQQQLAQVLRTQAECYLTLGKPAKARPICLRALAVSERSADANPGRLDLQTYHADMLCLLGDIEVADGQPGRARGYFEQVLALRRKRVEADPSHLPAIALVADAIRRIGTTLQASGRPAEAVDQYRRSIATLKGLRNPRALDLYDIACCHSLISGLAALAGSRVSAEEAKAEAGRAVAGVRRAFEAGYSNLAWVRTGDPDLQPIRSRPDFQALMMDLAMPAEPFAR